MHVPLPNKFIRCCIIVCLFLWLASFIYLGLSHITSVQKDKQLSSLESVVNDLIIRVDQDSKKIKQSLEHPPANQAQALECPKIAEQNGTSFDSHEVLRRRSLHYTREIWNTAAVQLELLATKLNDSPLMVQKIREVRAQIGDITRYLEVDLHGLGRVDGAAQRQIGGLDRLAKLLIARLESLQNPTNSCSKSRILLVSLHRPCAFGCNVHHLVYCFIFAYASGRTLLLESSVDEYTRWWAKNFLPLSPKCQSEGFQTESNVREFNHSSLNSNMRLLRCPYIGELYGKNNLLPPAIPADLSPHLAPLHSAPFVWFAGQLLAYLMRPTDDLQKSFDEKLKHTQLNEPSQRRTPIVGIHVRRTDKVGTEASFHHLSEYMVHVDRYFDMVDAERQMMARTHEWQRDSLADTHDSELIGKIPTPVPRRIYIATDDASVFQDAARLYPNYTFFGDPKRADLAGGLSSRNTEKAIFDITFDITALSRADYLVCTFSSQVCRVAYELLQTRHTELGDASWRFNSLDDNYYFGGQQANDFEAVIADTKHQITPGSQVMVLGNHWDGFARVHRHGQDSLLPAYKFRPRLLAVPMGPY